MALAAGISPRLRPPDPHTVRRQGRSRGLSSSLARPDGAKEVAEPGAAPGEPGEGDASMVNGEAGGVAPLAPGLGWARAGPPVVGRRARAAQAKRTRGARPWREGEARGPRGRGESW